jgi:type I restriction enzyme S subunit
MRVKLEDVCERGSSNLKQSDVIGKVGSYPIYGAAGYIGNVEFYHQEQPYVAVVKDGAGIGRAMLCPAKSSVIGTMQYLLPKENILPEYLYYVVKYMHLEKYFTGATIPHIYFKDYKNEEFNLDPLDKQQKVVDILKETEKIIWIRNKELTRLDYLIKARFVEMFGDPVSNPYGWDKVNISTVVCGRVSNGYFAKRQEYVEDGNVAIIGVAHVVNRMYSQVEGLPRTNASDVDIQKHKVGYGDMLFCRSSLVAEGIGKASIVPENTPDNTLFECHVIRLPLNLNMCIPEYMQVLSTTEYFRKQIIAQSKTATMTTIGQDGILKATIILPPIEKQREFYSFVKQVDKSKAAVQKSLDETQLLFDSLMQKYFG